MANMDDLSVEQKYALTSAAATLKDEFEGTFGRETIEQFLVTSYDQFAGHATVATFLPLMAERFARQRLKALAKVEGKADDGLPIVLFLCVHNAGRSQMALGWFNFLAGDQAVAWSGGSEPGKEVNPSAVLAMPARCSPESATSTGSSRIRRDRTWKPCARFATRSSNASAA